jgi:tripartite-type tricarboxylate transporter receptor subunit TctC
MVTWQRIFFGLAALGLLLQAGPPASAQDFPTQHITLVVPFPPGGSIDVVLRTMATKLQARLGKPVMIENRVGGAGVIAAAAVAKSPPDGHTLYAAASSFAANPKLYKTLPFDTLKDFATISLLFHTPLALVVNPDLPVKSVAELIALLKQKPGQISFAHSGPGAAIYLSAELFQTMTGTKMNGVVYRGAPLGLNDVMAGHVEVMFADTGSVLEQIAAGKVRALGVTSTTRVPAASDIPTIAEAGVPGYDAVGWTLICAPAATPRAIVDKLHAELTAVAAMPDVRALVIRLGTIPVDSPPPAELSRFLASEISRWGGIIEKAGVAGSH